MITTFEVAPPFALAPFVRCYTYREFDTGGIDITKPWHASHEPNIVFFFKALPVKLVDADTGKILKTGKSSGVVGLSSVYGGEMTFNGSYSFLQIIFRPTGFYKIFNIQNKEINNQIVWGNDILNAEINFLEESVNEVKEVTEKIARINDWLLHRLMKQKWIDYKDPVTASANLILMRNGNVNIDELARYANMSIRSLERHFLSMIGISPKHLCCIKRFNRALQLKLQKPALDWTYVAYLAGYFDQMHLIKDFRRFSGEVPSQLFKVTPLFTEAYTSPMVD